MLLAGGTTDVALVKRQRENATMETYVAPSTTLRTPRLAVAILAAALAGGLALAAAFASGTLSLDGFRPSRSDGAITQVHPGYGTDYPAHGGLAGPSFVGGADYPAHGGLAGPSRVRPAPHPGYGADYPAHGGLAGPSQVGGDASVEHHGADYPAHGGLAGPSGPQD